MPTGSPAYLVGRKQIQLSADANPLSDVLVAGQRLDGAKLSDRVFRHCTFANVSFKEGELADCEFLDCAFLNCYFRKTQVRNCSFVGSKFYGCEFPKISLQSVDLRYAHFNSCAPSYAELEHNFPTEPNLRQDLASNLGIAADDVGNNADARRFRLAAVAARERHLCAAFKANSSWYRTHFPGHHRLVAGLQLLGSKVGGWIWGHGEKWGVVLRNLAILTLLVFPAILLPLRGAFQFNGRRPAVGDLFWISVTTVIPVGDLNTVATTDDLVRTVLTIESFVGIILLGLIGAMLFQRIVGK